MATEVVHKGTGLVTAQELLDVLAAHPETQERVTVRFGPPTMSKLLLTEVKLLLTEVSNDKGRSLVSIEPRPITEMLRYARQLAKGR